MNLIDYCMIQEKSQKINLLLKLKSFISQGFRTPSAKYTHIALFCWTAKKGSI